MTARPNLQQVMIAIGVLLERGYGKPPQAIELTSGDTDLAAVSAEDLANRAAAILERVGRRQAAPPSGPPS